jgi:hypothetical protein
MARRFRSPTLETRAARLRLRVRRKPYFLSVAPGVSLGYRRNLGPGSWLVRCADGKGGAWTKGFSTADDFEDASGEQVLDFWAAQVRAREQSVSAACRVSASMRMRVQIAAAVVFRVVRTIVGWYSPRIASCLFCNAR